MNNSSNTLISHIQALQRQKKERETAQNLLVQLANHVWPIMRKRNWKVGKLVEFLPSNPNLLGLNVNKGREIKIRLRPANSDEGSFFPFHHLLGTMLHELVHIVRGPHDAQFYKYLDELWDEYESDRATRIPDGSILGGRKFSETKGKQIQLASAERRAVLDKIMPKGGRKLGGSAPKDLKKAILEAAERRARDSKWCGSNDDLVEIIGKVSHGSHTALSSLKTKMNEVEVIVISDSEEDLPSKKFKAE